MIRMKDNLMHTNEPDLKRIHRCAKQYFKKGGMYQVMKVLMVY